jgi:hypothetical protein
MANKHKWANCPIHRNTELDEYNNGLLLCISNWRLYDDQKNYKPEQMQHYAFHGNGRSRIRNGFAGSNTIPLYIGSLFVEIPWICESEALSIRADTD